MSEEEADELRHMRENANVKGDDLDPLATMTIDRQQECLASMENAAQHRWWVIEMTMKDGVWSESHSSLS